MKSKIFSSQNWDISLQQWQWQWNVFVMSFLWIIQCCWFYHHFVLSPMVLFIITNYWIVSSAPCDVPTITTNCEITIKTTRYAKTKTQKHNIGAEWNWDKGKSMAENPSPTKFLIWNSNEAFWWLLNTQ